MTRVCDRVDFASGSVAHNYRRYSFFADRARVIASRFKREGKILVAGCAWGFLVDELLDQGFDAWGVDASSYCIEQAANIISPPRVHLGNCMVQADMEALRVAAGLRPAEKFSLCITEDLLPAAATDDEVVTMLTELRRVSKIVFHLVTCANPADPNDALCRLPGWLWKSATDWKALVKPDLLMNTETGEIL